MTAESKLDQAVRKLAFSRLPPYANHEGHKLSGGPTIDRDGILFTCSCGAQVEVTGMEVAAIELPRSYKERRAGSRTMLALEQQLAELRATPTAPEANHSLFPPWYPSGPAVASTLPAGAPIMIRVSVSPSEEVSAGRALARAFDAYQLAAHGVKS